MRHRQVCRPGGQRSGRCVCAMTSPGTDAAGTPHWAKAESQAAEAVPATVGELSVVFNRGRGRWTMTSTDALCDQVSLPFRATFVEALVGTG